MYVTFDPDLDQNLETAKFGFRSHDGEPTLKDMQEAVGGLIEAVDLFEDEDGTVSMYVNEEGLYLCEPSLVIDKALYYPNGLTVYGPVIVCRLDNLGETVGLKESDLDRIEFDGIWVIDFEVKRMLPFMEVVVDG